MVVNGGSSCNPRQRSRAGQGSRPRSGRAVESLQGAMALQYSAWMFPCGNKHRFPKVWSEISTEKPGAPAAYLRGLHINFRTRG